MYLIRRILTFITLGCVLSFPLLSYSDNDACYFGLPKDIYQFAKSVIDSSPELPQGFSLDRLNTLVEYANENDYAQQALLALTNSSESAPLPIIDYYYDEAEQCHKSNRYVVISSLSNHSMLINDKPVYAEIVYNYNTDMYFVPFRVIFETSSALVSWDDKSKSAKASIGDTTVVVQENVQDMRINDVFVHLEVAPFIFDNRMFVPIQTISCVYPDTTWDNERKLLVVNT